MKEYMLGDVDAVPEGSGRAFAVGNRTIAVFRAKGKVFALNNRCVHKGASMCEGEVTTDGTEVRCPWHNWPFELATGRHRLDPSQRTRTYNVRIEDGQIILSM
jgi:nitrite reductase (NADH) small subunit